MRFPLLIPLLVAGLLAVGCGSSDDESGTGTGTPVTDDATAAVSAADLDGRTFVSHAVAGRRLVGGTKLQLSFQDGALSASAGCNSIRGGYAVTDGRLAWTEPPAQTTIGCEPALQRQDDWLAGWLTAGATVAPAGADGLTLTGDGVTVELREDASVGKPPPIVGTTWRLDSLAERSGTVSSLPAGVEPPTLRFTAGGRAEVFAGCNGGSAPAQVRDDGFAVFGPLILTRKACDEAAMRVERTVASVLDGRAALGFEGPRLVVAKDGRQLIFAAG